MCVSAIAALVVHCGRCWAGWAGLGSSCTVTVSPLQLSSALKLQPSGYSAPAPVTGAPGGREGGAGTWAPVRSAEVPGWWSAAGVVECRGRWCSGELMVAGWGQCTRPSVHMPQLQQSRQTLQHRHCSYTTTPLPADLTLLLLQNLIAKNVRIHPDFAT